MSLILPPTVNGLKALSVRLSIPWRGVWVADIEVDAPIAALVPLAGPALLLIGTKSLLGTVDPRGSGVFLNRVHLRVVGGQNGWDKEVSAQHFNNPAGALISTLVYAATAAEVLEPPPLDPIPEIYGKDFGRVKGAASRVFGDRQWFVEPTTGIATVTDWPPGIPDPAWTIVDFDIGQKRVSIISDNVILPGTVIVDPRLGAEAFIARDVEMVFDHNGSHADVWLSKKPVSRIAEAMRSMVQELGGTAYLKTYKYRFVLPIGGKLALQAITKGAPDLNPIDQWTGLSGITASLAGQAALFPSTEIVVGFVGGDPTEPFLVAFAPLNKPLGITLDAVTFVNVGAPTSPAAKAIGVQAQITALQAEILAIVAALTVQANAGAWLPPAAVSTMTPALAAAVAAATPLLLAGAAITPSPKLFVE